MNEMKKGNAIALLPIGVFVLLYLGTGICLIVHEKFEYAATALHLRASAANYYS